MFGDYNLYELLHKFVFGDQLDDVLNAPCLDGRSFAHAHAETKIFSVSLCISVSEAAYVSRDGKTLCVSGSCSLREILQEVGFGDRVNDGLGERTASLGFPDLFSVDAK